ncbi:ankyrin repeat domain-containing protein 49-like [Venturia canescens]|uniref:ankyrin repeat domain-containing protein 49-like n=1 Tax=Venturia canescens TaxID=32260 RepID=UPI001C9C9542|nr:ankyrin repeat domain-containing protein 49-like [Venturia canescens]
MSSDEENDDVQDLEAIRDKMMSLPLSERMQVSAWEDDDTGVEKSRYPKDPRQKAILIAAENGKIEMVHKWLTMDPSLISSVDLDGYTPLHKACYGNHVDVVEFLLEQGADKFAKTIDGWQPIHSACCWNNVECIATLLAANIDINARSNGKQTPLHLVCASSHNSPALQLLLLHPATDPSIVNDSGDTPQQIATRTGKYYPLFEIIEPCMNHI